MKNYIYGKNAGKNALLKNNTISKVFLQRNFKDDFILKLIKEKQLPVQYLSNAEMDNLVEKNNHQGIILETKEYSYYDFDKLIKELSNKEYPCLAILDGIEDPHNFGAILRSGDAFGIDGYIISSNRQVGLTPTVSHVSTGAIEYAKVCKVTNLNQTITKLKENGYWIVASDGKATMNYRDVDYKMKTAIIIGSEGKGIGPLLLKNSDFVTKIDMVGHVNSLNASVAASLYFNAVMESKKR